MADFEFAFTSAGTPNSFPISDSGVTGIDSTGLLAPDVVKIGDGVYLLLTAAKTDAELYALCKLYVQRGGELHPSGSGYFKSQATLQVTPALTEVPAAD